ncbi:MAG: FAD-binding protein, partial [Alicyclobacillus sp.]|nr:FAD-binding protein [Alicyclobacillus sp.]
GLFYPPDPGSGAVSTIGGNLATNAAGAASFRWGPTRHYVLGLKVVLADGTIISTGSQTSKNQSGYDLTSLMIGSEGTLGIITEATLRLLPRPDEVPITLVLGFTDIYRACEALVRVCLLSHRPTAVEMLDNECIKAVRDHVAVPIPPNLMVTLMVRFDAPTELLEKLKAQTSQFVSELSADYVAMAIDPEEQDQLWELREAISPAIARIKPTKISEDATVPVESLPLFLSKLKKIREKYGLNLVVFGHVGDGNLHPNILCDERDSSEMQRVSMALEELFASALDCGGTLSGEHGIGELKRPFMTLAHSETVLRLMNGIKTVFDPYNRLNPGKVLPEGAQP